MAIPAGKRGRRSPPGRSGPTDSAEEPERNSSKNLGRRQNFARGDTAAIAETLRNCQICAVARERSRPNWFAATVRQKCLGLAPLLRRSPMEIEWRASEQVFMRARRARRAAGRCAFEALTRDVIAIARGAVGGVIGADAHEGWDSVGDDATAFDPS